MKTMKSWMFAAILLCGTSMSAQAQDSDDYYQTKDEFAVTIGNGTTTQFLNVFSNLFGVMGEALITGTISGGQFIGYTTYENEKNIPPVSVEYFHHTNKVVSFGAIVGFSGMSQDMYCNFQRSGSYTSTKEKVGSGHKYYITVMPAAKFDWLRKKNYGLYSKVAVGATLMIEKEKQDVNGEKKTVHDDTDLMFNLQASLIGIEAGSQNFRGFAELGFGEQGLIVAGLRYKF